MGFGNLPVCIAKTPFSLTADPKALGAPKGFDLPVQRVILNAGAVCRRHNWSHHAYAGSSQGPCCHAH